MSSEDLTHRVIGLISKVTRDKLDELVVSKKTPLSKLIAYAIEHEFDRGKNAFDYDVTLPDDDFVFGAYVEESGKLMDYMKKTSGLSLDMMCFMRHDMGITDKKTFLYAFRECLTMGLLEEYKPKQTSYARFQYEDDLVFYRVVDANRKEAKKLRRKASDYELMLKLQKKFKDEV